MEVEYNVFDDKKEHERILKANRECFTEAILWKELGGRRAWLYHSKFRDAMYDLANDFDEKGYNEAANMLREKLQSTQLDNDIRSQLPIKP